MDNRHALRIANGYFSNLVDRIPANGWGLPTPCAEWNVREVVEHVASGHTALVRAFCVDSSPAPATSRDADDAAAAFRWWAAQAEATIEEPGALERTVRHPMFGELTGDALALIRWGDVCVHAWDLAQAIDADFTHDPDLTAAALEWLVPFAPLLGSTGAFAPAVDPGPASDPFARVLALTGRLTS